MSSQYKKAKKGKKEKKAVDLATIRKRNSRKMGNNVGTETIVPPLSYSVGKFGNMMMKPIVTKFTVISIDSLVNQNGYNTFGQNLTFQLSDFSACDGYSSFVSLYDCYRISKINIHLEILPPPFSRINSALEVVMGTTGSVWLDQAVFIKPTEYIYWDDVQGTSPTYTLNKAGWDDLLNRDEKKFKRGHILDITYKPRPLQEAFQSDTPLLLMQEVAFKENPWISTNNETGLNYYGINIYSNNADNKFNADQVVQTYVFTVTAYVEFYQPKL